MKKKAARLASLLAVIFLLLNQSVYAGGPEQSREPWLVYAGAFGGYYSADYQYGGTIFTILPSNEVIGTILTQPGALGGLQFGFQYHFQSPYSLGINLSAAVNAGKGRVNIFDFFGLFSDAPGSGPSHIHYQFRVNGNVDIAGVFGLDITPQTYLYFKAGASYTTLTGSFFTSREIFMPNPIPVFQNLDRKALWGWIVGVGLVQDINRWWSAFVEYDRYDYGNNNLNAVDGLFSGTPDRLTQHVRVTASAVRLGFNIKFMGNYIPTIRNVINNPWLFYLGAFAGYSSAAYQYGGNYFTNDNAGVVGNVSIGYTAIQQGFSGGGQLGVQYHLSSPYFVGLNVSIASDADKARSSIGLEISPIGPAIEPFLEYQFRTAYNLDMTGVFGLDVTPRTHLYAKIGAAYTRLIETLDGVIGEGTSSSTIFFRQREHHYFWGWALGVGLAQDLNRYWSVFGEYDRYDYGNNNLNSLDQLFGGGDRGADHLTQHVRLTTSTVRLGLNLKFNGNIILPVARNMIENPWQAYLGGFVGYYSATYQYDGHYFSNTPLIAVGNQPILVSAFQRGFSAGGQIGLQYHFQSLWFTGVNFSGASNASKARVSVFAELPPPATSLAPASMSYQFRISANVDMSGIVGLDILPKTHLYAKLGASYAAFTTSLVGTYTQDIPIPTASFSRLQRKNFWGWVVGLGLTQDLSRCVNMFVEYNRYDYGRYELNTFDGLFSGGIDHLVQNIRTAAYTVRLGFNLKFSF